MERIAGQMRSPPYPLSHGVKAGVKYKKRFARFSRLFAREEAEKSLNMIAPQANKSNFNFFVNYPG